MVIEDSDTPIGLTLDDTKPDGSVPAIMGWATTHTFSPASADSSLSPFILASFVPVSIPVKL